MKKSETPWKQSVLEMLNNKHKSVELMPSQKNPANCDLEASVMELPPTPLVKTLGYGTGVQVFVVKRNLTTEERSPWAIKMLSARDDPKNSALFDKRLSEEAVILRNLRHPNIVGFREFDTFELGRSFLALEYCNTSLGEILEGRYNKSAGPLEAYKGKRMTIHVLRGLVYLHEEAHILHGDLKSFNVLINKDFENAKICDFGVSVPLNQDGYLDRVKAPEGRYVGTALWSAPEVFKNDPALISVKADIFALGMTVYETLTLTPPHTFAGIMDEAITQSASVARRRLDMSMEGEVPEDEEDGDATVIMDSEDEDGEVHDEDGEVYDEDGEVHDEEGAECDEALERILLGEEETEAPRTNIDRIEPAKRKLADDDQDHLQKKQKTTSEEPIECKPAHNPSNVDDVPPRGEEHKQDDSTPPKPVAENSEGNGEDKKQAQEGDQTPPKPVAEKSEGNGEDKKRRPSEDVIKADEGVIIDGNPSTADDVPRCDEQKDPTPPMPVAENPAGNGEDKNQAQEQAAEQTIDVPDDDDVISISSSESVVGPPILTALIEDDSEEDSEEGDSEYGSEEDSDHEYPLHDDDDADAEGEYEEDDYEDGQYLNYAVLGTRPPLPTSIEIGEEHLPLVELFYVCTEVQPGDRPTARQLLEALSKTMYAQGETLDAVNKPSEAENKPSDAENKPPEAEKKPSDAENKPSETENKPSNAEKKPLDDKQTTAN